MKTAVFLSWSGERARAVAEALHSWLPKVLQMCEPWYSPNAIEAGARWSASLAKPLAEYRFGIFCVTPENVRAEWLLFEAGCLSRALDDEARVVPYLCGLQPAQVTGPLAQFQMKKADKEGTLDVVRALNARLNAPLADALLAETFEDQWPKLRGRLNDLPVPQTLAPRKRDHGEILEETLTMVRGLMRRMDETAPARPRVRRPVSKSARDPRSAREAVFHAVVAVVLARRDVQEVRRSAPMTDSDWFAEERVDRAERALSRVVEESRRVDPGINVEQMRYMLSDLLGAQ